jgi:FkbM family methyltransferase
MIVNRNDYHMVDANRGYGVGYQIMQQSCYDPNDVNLALGLLNLRRQYFGDGVVAIDCGANIGVHTIEWGAHMTGWGFVHAFEAQEKIFYALAGNVALNNCLNVSAKHCAVGADVGAIDIPEPDYTRPASFGSFEIQQRENTEFIGQTIDYANQLKSVPMTSLDALELERVDLIKIDVEGMEEQVLEGATALTEKFKPIMFVEVIKSDRSAIEGFFSARNYKIMNSGMNILAVHEDDQSLSHIGENKNTDAESEKAGN